MPADAKRLVIVGGGAAGLGAGYILEKRGPIPTLFKAGDHVGGRPTGRGGRGPAGVLLVYLVKAIDAPFPSEWAHHIWDQW